MTALVPSNQPADSELESLRLRMTSLEAELRERSDLVAQVSARLDAFKIRYRQEVGLLHEELDELEREIDEADRGERAKRAQGDATKQAAAPARDVLPRYTSDAVRSLFRDVAKAIHPDLARDELARDRRHRLMIRSQSRLCARRRGAAPLDPPVVGKQPRGGQG